MNQIEQLQEWFLKHMEADPYPLYPNYGRITPYEALAINFPEQRQLRQPGEEK